MNEVSYKTRQRTINTFDKNHEFSKISLLFRGKSMSKLKLCLFLIFLAVWKFQIRDKGRGGYCGSSWISLSSVHNSSHRLHFQKKNCHTLQVHSAHRQISLSSVHFCTQRLPLLQHFNKILHCTPQMGHFVIIAYYCTRNCRRKQKYFGCYFSSENCTRDGSLTHIREMFRDSYC